VAGGFGRYSFGVFGSGVSRVKDAADNEPAGREFLKIKNAFVLD
jgi:hypothetical protein